MRRILLLTIATAMVTTLMVVPAGVAFAKLAVCPPQIDLVGDLTECLILGSVDPGGGGGYSVSNFDTGHNDFSGGGGGL